MIHPSAGSAAAVLTYSCQKPLSMCSERACTGMYVQVSHLVRDELSELARFRGGVEPFKALSKVDAFELAEPGEVADGTSCEPVGSDSPAAGCAVTPDAEPTGELLRPIRVSSPIFDSCPNLDGSDELVLHCLNLDPARLARSSDRRRYEIVAEHLACACLLNPFICRPLFMVATRRNPDSDEALAVHATAEPSGSLTPNVTNHDSQHMTDHVTHHVTHHDSQHDTSNTAATSADQVRRTAAAENSAAEERDACAAAVAQA
jgi:hypothetical protein